MVIDFESLQRMTDSLKMRTLNTLKCSWETWEEVKQAFPDKIDNSLAMWGVKVTIDDSVQRGQFKGYDVDGFLIGTYFLRD